MFLKELIILLNLPIHTMLAYYNMDHPLIIIIINKMRLLMKIVPMLIRVIIASLVLTGMIHQVQQLVVVVVVVEYHKLVVVLVVVIIPGLVLIRVWMI
jgi:hypothetical protein